jgi:aspartate kinase
MNPTIIKFGGTSLENAQAFARAADIVLARIELQPVVIVSAMSGVTDALVESTQTAARGEPWTAQLESHFQRHAEVATTLLGPDRAKQFLANLDIVRDELAELIKAVATSTQNRGDVGGRDARGPRQQAALCDAVLSQGERLSSLLMAALLQEYGITARVVEPQQCIVTNDDYGSALPLFEATVQKTRETLNPLLADSLTPVVGGFIGATIHGQTTTLGRGGSDYTAALIGSVLAAREIQIWTDVNGVLTADPKLVPNAQTIRRLSYAEAAELAYFGAKVLHPKTIQPAVEGNIPVRICNSRLPVEEGTLVAAETETSARTVKAIAHKKGVTTIQITSARMLGAYGFLRALFEVFDRHRTAVDVVTTSEVSVSLSLDDEAALPAITDELQKLGAVRVERGRAIICVVGEGLRGTPGIAAIVFSTISDINVTLISQGASSVNLTFAIQDERVEEAVSRLHDAFFEESKVESRRSRVDEIGKRMSAYTSY